jgi:hypothetical protein
MNVPAILFDRLRETGIVARFDFVFLSGPSLTAGKGRWPDCDLRTFASLLVYNNTYITSLCQEEIEANPGRCQSILTLLIPTYLNVGPKRSEA